MLSPRRTTNFWLLPVALLSLAVNNEVAGLACDAIKDGSSYNLFKDCQIPDDDDNPLFGHTKQFVRLNFSDAAGMDITGFFAKAKKDATLQAAITLVGNPNVNNINFGRVIKWEATKMEQSDDLVIEIVDNPALVTIEWDIPTFTLAAGVKLRVYIYNNPLLEWKGKADQTLKMILGKADSATSYSETELHVCHFQHPVEHDQYKDPTLEFLKLCNKVKGDLKLKQMTLPNNLEVVSGCLSLVDVKMDGKTITAPSKIGTHTCKSGGVSEIKNNENLCGDAVTTMMDYFTDADRPSVIIELHSSCTKSCTLQIEEVDHPYYRCGALAGDLSISSWFGTDLNLAEHRALLTKATGKTTISQITVDTISLPEVTSMAHLEIVNNSQLTTLDFPKLTTVGELTMTGHPLLSLKEIKKLPVPTKSAVECTTGMQVVDDIEDICLCTIIKGPLMLKNVKKDADPSFKISELEGCVTVEDTELSNIDFLESAKITCSGTHTLIKNPKLCKPDFLEKNGGKVTETPASTKTQCGKVCTSLTQKNCVVFNGDLAIGSSITAADVQLLETVNGRLTISDLIQASLEFPALTMISSPDVPALVVANNSKLATLKMPKMAKIVSAKEGRPLVKIENNPLLNKDLKDFLPASIRGDTSRSSSSLVQFDLAEETSSSDNTTLYIILGSAAALVVAGGLSIWGGVSLYKKRKRKKKSRTAADEESIADEQSGTGTVAETETVAEKVEKVEKVEKPKKFKVLGAVQTRNPPISNTVYLHEMARTIMVQPRGIIQFRIVLRVLPDANAVERNCIEKSDLLYTERLKGGESAIKTNIDRLKLNRRVFLANKDYSQNNTEFLDNLFEAEIKAGMEKKQEKDKVEKRMESGKAKPSTKAKGKSKETKKTKGKKGSSEEKKEKKGKKASKGKKEKKGKKAKDASKKGKKASKTKTKVSKTSKPSKKTSKASDADSTQGGEDERSKLSNVPEEPKEAKEPGQLIHIGSGFEKVVADIKNLKLTVLEDPYKRSQESEKFECLTCKLVQLEYTRGDKTYTKVVELTEMIVPETLTRFLVRLLKCPWVSLLLYAWQNKIVVHTNLPDYLVLCFYFYSTIDFLNYRIGEQLPGEQFEVFPISTMYPMYHRIFAGDPRKPKKVVDGKELPPFDEIVVLQFYIAYILDWSREILPKENGISVDAKQQLLCLQLADEALGIRDKHDPDNKLGHKDAIYWNVYNTKLLRNNGEAALIFPNTGENIMYYNNHLDPTPRFLPVPREKLRYSAWVEYDEAKDCLVKPEEPKSLLYRPKVSDSAMSLAQPEAVNSQMLPDTPKTLEDAEYKVDPKKAKKEEPKVEKVGEKQNDVIL